MVEAKKNEVTEVASFEKVLKEIDSSAESLNKSSDFLRTKIRALCGFVEKRYDPEKHPGAAKEMAEKLTKEGWHVVSDNKSVIGTGALVDRLKATGIEYCSAEPFYVESYEHYNYEIRLCFGKVYGNWQFYCSGGTDFDEFPTAMTLEDVGRKHLQAVIKGLPGFLTEYSNHLKSTKVEMETNCKQLDTLAKNLAEGA